MCLIHSLTLPEREEDDGLDSEELQHRAVRMEQIPSGGVEEEEAVESERDGEVVDHRDVDVALVEAPVAVLVLAHHHQEQREHRHDRLDEAELQRGLLAEAEELDGVLLSGQAAGASPVVRRSKTDYNSLLLCRMNVLDLFSTNLGHDVAFSAKVLVAQAQETVDHER